MSVRESQTRFSRGGPVPALHSGEHRIVQSVVVDSHFFEDGRHHYSWDNFCPQQQEQAACASMQDDSRQPEPKRKTYHRLQVPVKNPNAGPRLTKAVKPLHSYSFGDPLDLETIHSLYHQWMEDLPFCHQFRMLGGTLHPRFPGTLLVLVDAHENFHVPEFYPPERNDDLELCPIGRSVPRNKKFLHIHTYYVHEAEILLKSHSKVPARHLWLQRLLDLHKCMPTQEEQAAQVGKAVLRYAFSYGHPEVLKLDPLDMVRLTIV